MKNNMLFIGDKQVDLDNNTRLTQNFKSNMFIDLSRIISNSSYTIKLPNTVLNQKIIMHAEFPA